jgi:transposase
VADLFHADDQQRCPICGFVGSIDAFDCLGGESDDSLFCPECGREFNSVTDKEAPRA